MQSKELKIFRTFGAKVYTLAPFLIVVWLVIAAVLNIFIPQLEKTIADKSAPFFPSSNSGVVALKEMARDFQRPMTTGLTQILFVDDAGISADDEAYYHRLIHELADTAIGKENVATVVDIFGSEPIKNVATSKDHKAFYLTLTLRGELGSSQTEKALAWVHKIIDDPSLEKPSGLQVKITGATPVFVEELHAIDNSMLIITIVSAVIILLLLIIIYRSFITALIPLMNIGVSLACGRAVISLLGQWGIIPISSFSLTISTAIALGAGIDYAIFLISNYHEERNNQLSKIEALSRSVNNISKVIIASGITVALVTFSMIFLKINFFRTAGPPIAIGVLVTLLVSFTFCPALMAITIRFTNFLENKVGDHASYWRKRAALVLHKPIPLVVLLTIALLACSALLFGMKTGFVENRNYSSQAESNQGFSLSDKHFPPYTMLPEFLFVHSDHDMRDTRDLAALELAAQAISTSPVVANVQSITRPTGEPLEDTVISNQAGIVGGRLQNGVDLARKNMPLLHKLADGTQEIADTVNLTVKNMPPLKGADSIASLAKALLNTSAQVNTVLKKSTHNQSDLYLVLQKLHDGSQGLLQVINSFGEPIVQTAINIIVFVNNFLQDNLDSKNPPLDCLHSDVCMQGRKLYSTVDFLTHGALHALAKLLRVLPRNLHDLYARLNAAAPDLKKIDKNLTDAIGILGKNNPNKMQERLDPILNLLQDMQGQMKKLSDGIDQVNDGTHQALHMVMDSTNKLQEAASFLRNISQTTSPRSGGYNIPAQGFRDPKYIAGSKILLSPDGKTAQMVITFAKNPFTPEVFDALPSIYNLAHNALQGMSLESAQISSTGTAGIFHGFKPEVADDTILLTIIAIVVVLIVLIVLLRSLVAPLIIMVFVLLSFGATMGITVLLWQYIFGQELHWSVIPVAFITVVAVGSDYSMLFVSRIRNEVRTNFNDGLIRSFETTGQSITVAGLVFAITMFALMASRVHNLEQIGFSVGFALIIDVVIIRTMLVPSMIVLLKERAWWPDKVEYKENELEEII